MPIGWIEGIIFGEAQTNFGKKCHIFLEFYCLKRFHDPNLGEASTCFRVLTVPPSLIDIERSNFIFYIWNFISNQYKHKQFQNYIFFKFLPFIFDDIY